MQKGSRMTRQRAMMMMVSIVLAGTPESKTVGPGSGMSVIRCSDPTLHSCSDRRPSVVDSAAITYESPNGVPNKDACMLHASV